MNREEPARTGRAADAAEPRAGAGRMHLLYVCTGNTCRSPMAEAITRWRAERGEFRHLKVRSAGTMAFEGTSVSEGARRVAAREGMELGGHRARRLTPEILAWADLILVMAPSHLAAVGVLGGGCYAEVITDFVGDPARQVADPFGGGDREYREAFEQLDHLVVRVLTRLGGAAVAPRPPR